MKFRSVVSNVVNNVKTGIFKKNRGVDGILVTVGLCIIALLLCVVMKDSLKTFVETIVGALQTEAKSWIEGITV